MPLSGDIVQTSDLPSVIAYGLRTTVTPVTGWVTTEAGSLRLDNITMKAAKLYRIWTNPLNLVPSVLNDVINVRVRVSNAGVATVASTEIGHIRSNGFNTANGPLQNIEVEYNPAADTTTASVLLTVERAVAGTSSLGVRLWGNTGNESVQLYVADLGPLVANTGVVL